MKVREPSPPSPGLIYLGLGLITVALYLPLAWHGFVDYDDQQYVTENPRVQAGLTRAGLVWAFGFHAGNWHPLAWLSHMLDCRLFAAWAGGHHLTSLVFHLASAWLLFAVLDRMTGKRWRSAMVAGLFAWHPLHVESVAWVAERKDVLCAFFWMLTLWFYARRMARPERGVTDLAPRLAPKAGIFYALALLSFALCLMSKPMGVTLPFVLLLLDFWPLNRLHEWRVGTLVRLVAEKIPFFALAAGACWLTLQAQELAIVSTAGLPVAQRLAHVLVAYQHYFLALFVPWHLAVYYPYDLHLPALAVVVAGALLILLTVLAGLWWQRLPSLLTGWLWYLGTLVPVIGLVQVGDQAWADRYTYLPLIGLCVPLVWGVAEFFPSRRVLTMLALGATAGMFVLTSLQLRHWQNTRTLFTHADQVTTKNYLAVTILGSLLAKEYKYDEAMALYQKALDYQPTFPEAHFFLGNALDAQGKLDAALAEYSQALWFRPTQEQTHIFIAMVLAKQNKYAEASAHYEAALRLNPDSAVAHNNLARLFHSQGRLDEAIVHYHAALELDPKLELAHNNLGILLLQKGRTEDGIRQLREALHLKPANAETMLNLALALNHNAQWAEAANMFTRALVQRPTDANARYEYAVALVHLQQTHDALRQFASALLLRPDFPDALDGLAWVLSTDPNPAIRNGAEAIGMAQRACELTARQEPAKLKTLAAAFAETGQFEAALATLKTATELATKAKRTDWVKDYERMREDFEQSEPWRQKP